MKYIPILATALLFSACSYHKSIDTKCIEAFDTYNVHAMQEINSKSTNSLQVENSSKPVKKILVDASLSMKAKVSHNSEYTKIEEVKLLLTDLIGNNPSVLDNNYLEIITLGNHNNSCSSNFIRLDIKSTKDIDKIEKIELGSKLGKSPVVNSVKEIIENHQKFSSQPIDVIVITDGLENCVSEETAIETLKQLKYDSKVGIKLHIIGYTTSDEENIKLRALADSTDGIFLSAQNRHELKEQAPVLLENSFGLINVEKPLEVDEVIFWRLYDNHNKLLATYSNSNFGFNEDIKLKSGSYNFCLGIGDDIFVKKIEIESAKITPVMLETLLPYKK